MSIIISISIIMSIIIIISEPVVPGAVLLRREAEVVPASLYLSLSLSLSIYIYNY